MKTKNSKKAVVSPCASSPYGAPMHSGTPYADVFPTPDASLREFKAADVEMLSRVNAAAEAVDAAEKALAEAKTAFEEVRVARRALLSLTTGDWVRVSEDWVRVSELEGHSNYIHKLEGDLINKGWDARAELKGGTFILVTTAKENAK